MPIYALLGITGHVGGGAAELLIAGGADVRAVVRSEAKAKLWRDRGAQSALATLDDPVALRAAFNGVDGAFIMTPTWFEAEDMFAESAAALKALHQALCEVPPTKLVLLSSIGAHRSHGTGAIMKLHDMEAMFADLPSVTSVRAAWFMENFAGMLPHLRETGVLPSMLAPLDRPIPMIATADIGRMVAATLQQDWHGQHVIELEGPRRYAPHDVATAFSTVLDRPVEAQVLPPSEWRSAYQAWGLTPRSAEAMEEMLNGFNTGWITYEKGEAETARGTTPLDALLAGLARR